MAFAHRFHLTYLAKLCKRPLANACMAAALAWSSVGVIAAPALAQAPVPAKRGDNPRLISNDIPNDAIANNTVPTWTLSQLEQTALDNNPTREQSLARLEALRGKWVQTGLWPNPTVGYSGQQLGSRGYQEQNGVILEQSLIRGGKLRLNREIVSQEIARAEQELEIQELRILTDTRRAYYDVLVAQRRVELQRELLQIGEDASRIADSLFNAKEVSRIDVVQARLEVQQARIAQRAAINRHLAAWRHLSAVIGRPELETTTLTGDLRIAVPDFDWDETLGRLWQSSPEVTAVIADIDRARSAVARARVEPTPDVTVQGIVQKDHSIHSTDGALQVTIPFPIFNRNQGGIRQAYAEQLAAEKELERLELDLQRRLAEAFERYSTAKTRVEQYDADILPLAKESLALTRSGYQAGEINYLTLLIAQRTFSQTNIAFVEALGELWDAAMEIDGQLLTDSLANRNP